MCLSQVQAWTHVLKYLPILINIPDAQVRNLRVILDVIHGDQEEALTDHQLGLPVMHFEIPFPHLNWAHDSQEPVMEDIRINMVEPFLETSDASDGHFSLRTPQQLCRNSVRLYGNLKHLHLTFSLSPSLSVRLASWSTGSPNLI